MSAPAVAPLKIFATSLTGTLGAELREVLGAKHELIGACHSEKSREELTAAGVKEIHHLDLADPCSIEKLAAELSPPDAVILNAGITNPASLQESFSVNTLAQEKLIRALAKAGKLPRRVIFVSSSLLTGPALVNGEPVPDEVRYAPGGARRASDYSQGKAVGEILVTRAYKEAFGDARGLDLARASALMATGAPMTQSLMTSLGLRYGIGFFPNFSDGAGVKLSFIGALDYARVIDKIIENGPANGPGPAVYDVENGEGGLTQDELAAEADKIADFPRWTWRPRLGARFAELLGRLASFARSLFGRWPAAFDAARAGEFAETDLATTNDRFAALYPEALARLAAEFPRQTGKPFETFSELLGESAVRLGLAPDRNPFPVPREKLADPQSLSAPVPVTRLTEKEKAEIPGMDFWRDRALSLIGEKNVRSRVDLAGRNRRITRAYAETARRHPELVWLAMVSYASSNVHFGVRFGPRKFAAALSDINIAVYLSAMSHVLLYDGHGIDGIEARAHEIPPSLLNAFRNAHAAKLLFASGRHRDAEAALWTSCAQLLHYEQKHVVQSVVERRDPEIFDRWNAVYFSLFQSPRRDIRRLWRAFSRLRGLKNGGGLRFASFPDRWRWMSEAGGALETFHRVYGSPEGYREPRLPRHIEADLTRLFRDKM